MKHAVKEAGLNWEVDSAGTGSWHVGNPPDWRSIRVAKNHGVDISRQVCRQFKIPDFDAFDLILVMDKHNLANVRAMARTEQDETKVKLFLGDKDVPDPYTDDTQFEPVFELIESGCADVIKDYS